MLKNIDSLNQTKIVFQALYWLFGLRKPTEIRNFMQKINLGIISLSNYLKYINLSKLRASNIQGAGNILTHVSEDELFSESEAAFNLHKWMVNTIYVYFAQIELEEQLSGKTTIKVNQQINTLQASNFKQYEDTQTISEDLDIYQTPERDRWSCFDFNVPESEIAGSKFPEWFLKKIKSMNLKNLKDCITEMTRFPNPPDAVLKVIKAVIYILGYKSK